MERKTRNIIYIVLISIIYRLLVIWRYYKFHFIGSFVPYPLDRDSYYFYHVLNFIPKEILFISYLVFVAIGLVYFYKICRLYLNE